MRSFALVFLLLLPVAAANGAISLVQQKSDPRGDVVEGIVEGSSGGPTIRYSNVTGHEDVDLLWVNTTAEGSEVLVILTVAGQIRDDSSANVTNGTFTGGGFGYNVALDTLNNDSHEYVLSYARGEADLRDQKAAREVDIEATKTGGVLTFHVPSEELGVIERWNYTAAAAETNFRTQGEQYRSEQYVDLMGPHPGYETWGTTPSPRTPTPHDGDEDDVGVPGVPYIGTVVALLAAGFAARRRWN